MVAANSNESETLPRSGPSCGNVNVGDAERLASGIGGGAIAIAGLVFFSSPIGKLASAAVGGALLYRAFTGHCHLYGAMNVSTAACVEAKPVNEGGDALPQLSGRGSPQRS